jgi:hypothetical protein
MRFQRGIQVVLQQRESEKHVNGGSYAHRRHVDKGSCSYFDSWDLERLRHLHFSSHEG